MNRNTKYAPMGEKFCQGICNREVIDKMLVCHGCKRVIADFGKINLSNPTQSRSKRSARSHVFEFILLSIPPFE